MSSNEPRPVKITVDQCIKLERCQSWDESFHIFDEESAFAVEMALATGRPLLVRGEPGSGKSQLARAAAQELNRRFIAEVITAASEGQDLLWRYDPVARLSDAQAHAAEANGRRHRRYVAVEKRNSQALADAPTDNQVSVSKKKKTPRHRKKKSPRQKKRPPYLVSRTPAPKVKRIELRDNDERILSPADYVSPGALWWVFDSASACRQHQRCRYPFYYPGGSSVSYETFDGQQTAEAERGFVLLIDEIDKADPSLPNALLEVLGNGGFHVPLLDESVGMRSNHKKPLIIITTNEERELPAAFLRRCLVLHLRFDDKEYLRSWWLKQAEKSPQTFSAEEFTQERALIRWLSERAEAHFENVFTDRVKVKAAELLIKDREAARRAGTLKPGQAEYLDLLRALREMPDPGGMGEVREQYQLALLKKIGRYALVKSLPE